MEEKRLSDLERKVLAFIVQEKEVKIETLKTEFGEQGIGVLGRLKRYELVEIKINYTTGDKIVKLKEE